MTSIGVSGARLCCCTPFMVARLNDPLISRNGRASVCGNGPNGSPYSMQQASVPRLQQPSAPNQKLLGVPAPSPAPSL